MSSRRKSFEARAETYASYSSGKRTDRSLVNCHLFPSANAKRRFQRLCYFQGDILRGVTPSGRDVPLIEPQGRVPIPPRLVLLNRFFQRLALPGYHVLPFPLPVPQESQDGVRQRLFYHLRGVGIGECETIAIGLQRRRPKDGSLCADDAVRDLFQGDLFRPFLFVPTQRVERADKEAPPQLVEFLWHVTPTEGESEIVADGIGEPVDRVDGRGRGWGDVFPGSWGGEEADQDKDGDEGEEVEVAFRDAETGSTDGCRARRTSVPEHVGREEKAFTRA